MDTVLFGLRIIENPLLEPPPKLQLPPQCPCSDEMREEMNAYLLETFGRNPAKALFLPDGAVMVPPGMVQTIRKVMSVVSGRYLGGGNGR